MIYDKYAFTIPEGKSIRFITDTDAKNEADDQYAIAHALLTPRFDVRGIIASHFGDLKSKTSMEDSYQEVEKVLSLMDMDKSLACKGAPRALVDERTPIPSAGAELIIREALSQDARPLYVVFQGPLTNLASALLMEPRIESRLTAIWIGGGAYPQGGREYNLSNDIDAANVVFRSRIPLWQVPQNVYRMVMVSMAELEARVRPHGEIGRYLFEQLVAWGQTESGRRSAYRTGECWCLGDSPVVGLLLNEQDFDSDWTPAPEITRDMFYVHTGRNRPIRVYRSVDSRFILEDFYAKLALFARNRR